MAINFSTLVYLPCQTTFGRDITVSPVASQPGAPAYWNRGIYNTRGTVVQTDVGLAIISDQETILDVREVEYGTVPIQGDLIDIPQDAAGNPALGQFKVTDAWTNGGGETTLVLQKIVADAPTPVQDVVGYTKGWRHG